MPSLTAHFRHVGLNKNGAFLRIDTTSQYNASVSSVALRSFCASWRTGSRVGQRYSKCNGSHPACLPLTQRTHVVTNGQFT